MTNNPICSNCNGQTEQIGREEYECLYCGCILDEYGDVLHEVQDLYAMWQEA